ncbi:MAG: ester cyclase [Chitinophagales bacterium]|nr:ester cyclase [Chitinophagales bacterium]
MTDFLHEWIEAWNSHNTEKLLELYGDNFGNEVISEDKAVYEPDSFREMGHRFFNAFPDLKFDVIETVGQNEKLAIFWTARGTHKGKYINIPPTGKKLEVCGTTFLELRNGKVSKARFLWDGADMLRQMGLLPEIKID